ncbi:MAG TPA: hypothetical protein VGP94_06065, partial [Tepidisphaeraceae bacterium]|nr:hypothetical protein [Tepidisphaeraceae bacterium]
MIGRVGGGNQCEKKERKETEFVFDQHEMSSSWTPNVNDRQMMVGVKYALCMGHGRLARGAMGEAPMPQKGRSD